MNIDLFIAECDLVKFIENNMDKVEIFDGYATILDFTISAGGDKIYIEEMVIESVYNQDRLDNIFKPIFDKQTIDKIYETINPHIKQNIISSNLTEEVE